MVDNGCGKQGGHIEAPFYRVVEGPAFKNAICSFILQHFKMLIGFGNYSMKGWGSGHMPAS